MCHTNTILPAGSSSSGSSSDDEVKEAFENTASPHSLWPGHTHPWPRPIRVPPTGCRKKAPKYFAQMSSAGAIERPRLDFNKMQYSKRFVMVSVLSSLPCHTRSSPSPSWPAGPQAYGSPTPLLSCTLHTGQPLHSLPGRRFMFSLPPFLPPPSQRPTLELALDLSHHSFQPVSAQM